MLPIRLLFNTPNSSLKGGPPTHLPLLEKGLKERCSLFNFDYGRKSDTETLTDKVIGRISDLAMMQLHISSLQPDIIHHNSAFDPMAILRDAPLAFLAKKHHVPLFIKIHGSLPEAFSTTSPLIKRLRASLLENTTAFGVLSEAEREEFHSHFPNTIGKVHVVKNILQPSLYENKWNNTWQNYPSAVNLSSKPRVLFISRFIKRKGIFDLLTAVPNVLSVYPDCEFMFIGGGEAEEEFDSTVKSRGLSKNVIKIPHIENSTTSQFYQDATLFVFPTHFPEGMPMVVAEAMATGTPIVTTPTRFSRSYMSEGVHCLYSTLGDANSLTNAILSLLRNDELRTTMSNNNRVLSRQFSQEIVTEEFVELYSKILGRRYIKPTISINDNQRNQQTIFKKNHITLPAEV
jgi:glycosyltransferase involved in cell wall biosynthesis